MKETLVGIRTFLGVLFLLILFYGVTEERSEGTSFFPWELEQTGKNDKAFRPSDG